MIDFIILHQLGILRVLNLAFWFYLYKKSNLTGINRDAVKYFVSYLALFTVWNILMILSENSGRVYLFFWAITTLYQLYFILTILFKLAGWNYVWIEIIIPALPTTLAAILSFKYSNYQPVNIVDFFNLLILLTGSILILRYILLKKSFVENIEAIFIFSGFILYFILHILASNILTFDFLKYWSFGKNATLIGFIYWIGSIVCIRKIRSRYS